MMCSALILVPKETNKLIAIMNMRSVYGRQKYKLDKSTKHVIVCGEVTDNVLDFLQVRN